MTLLLLLPVVLSFLLIAAHMLRHFGYSVAIPTLALMLLLLIPRRAAAIIVQVLLLLAALEWVRTLYLLVQQRQQAGDPYLRMTLIVGSVIVFTALSTLVFRSSRLRRRYR